MIRRICEGHWIASVACRAPRYWQRDRSRRKYFSIRQPTLPRDRTELPPRLAQLVKRSHVVRRRLGIRDEKASKWSGVNGSLCNSRLASSHSAALLAKAKPLN